MMRSAQTFLRIRLASQHHPSLRRRRSAGRPRLMAGVPVRLAMAKRTIIEIAERVGVSPATVSRALNNVRGVAPDKRRRILAVAEELKYHPKAIARSLQGQRTNTVAYVADVGNRPAADLLFKDFITLLADRCAGYGMDLLIHPATSGDANMDDVSRILLIAILAQVIAGEPGDHHVFLRPRMIVRGSS